MMNAKPFRLNQTLVAILTIASSLTTVTPIVRAAAYIENFNSGPGGWHGDNFTWQASGGVGDTGYIRGTRVSFSPNFGEVFDPPAANFTLGNLEAMYGNLINFSYQGKVFLGPVNSPPSQVFFSPGGTTGWLKIVAPSIAPFQSDWTSVSFDINTNWTDAEAQANGWTRPFGTTSWSGTLHNVGAQEVFYNLHTPQTPGQTFVTGIDNYRIAGVPEPSTWLTGTALSCVALLARRRSKAQA